MRRHLASPLASPLAPVLALVALLGLAPACKSMGGVMSGLGKVAAGAAKGVAHAAPAVARGMAKAAPAVARGVAQAGGAVARGVVHTAPTVLRATEAVIQTTADVVLSTPVDFDVGAGVEVPLTSGAGDPCQACPLDVECGVCAGYAGYACVASPAGALARCESSAPPDAPPAPEPPASAPPAPPPPGAAPGWFRF